MKCRIHRLGRLRHIEVTDIRRWGEPCREDRLLPFLSHLTSLPCLSSLHLTKVHLSRLPAASLVQAVLATPIVELDPLSNSLTTYQASLLLASLSSSDQASKMGKPKLSHLTLRNCSLTAVCPHLMTALANLSSFTALWVEFSPAQLEVLLTSLASSNSRLRSLTLPDYYCAGLATRALQPDTLATALASLQSLSYGCHVPDQLWNMMAEGRGRIKRMDVRRKFLIEHPSPDILARALNTLEEIDFEKNFPEDEDSEYADCFHGNQVVKIFERMSRSTSVKKLTLEINEENILNHLELPPGLFAKALLNIEEVIIEVDDERVFYEEIIELFRQISTSKESKLQKLRLNVRSSTKHKLSLPSALVSNIILRMQDLKLHGCVHIM